MVALRRKIVLVAADVICVNTAVLLAFVAFYGTSIAEELLDEELNCCQFSEEIHRQIGII